MSYSNNTIIGVCALKNENEEITSIAFTSQFASFYAEINNNLSKEVNDLVKNGFLYNDVDCAYETFVFNPRCTDILHTSMSMKDSEEAVQEILKHWLATEYHLSDPVTNYIDTLKPIKLISDEDEETNKLIGEFIAEALMTKVNDKSKLHTVSIESEFITVNEACHIFGFDPTTNRDEILTLAGEDHSVLANHFDMWPLNQLHPVGEYMNALVDSTAAYLCWDIMKYKYHHQ